MYIEYIILRHVFKNTIHILYIYMKITSGQCKPADNINI